ncbi:MAG: cupin domain-containing protein [Balneolaceae bacterium]|jgi:predicted cupin superfamily sugar epimerase
MPKKITTQDIINLLKLSDHPEGGFYREIYRADENVSRRSGQIRNAATGIYFLVPQGVCTRWHRVDSDELWHFYRGDPLTLEIIDREGNFQRAKLDDRLTSEYSYQQAVCKGCWQRAYSEGEYSLLGCTVAPGFDFDDFEIIESKDLAKKYPGLASEIRHNPFHEPRP